MAALDPSGRRPRDIPVMHERIRFCKTLMSGKRLRWRTACSALPAAAPLYALLIRLFLRLTGRAEVEVLRLALQGKDVLLLPL